VLQILDNTHTVTTSCYPHRPQAKILDYTHTDDKLFFHPREKSDLQDLQCQLEGLLKVRTSSFHQHQNLVLQYVLGLVTCIAPLPQCSGDLLDTLKMPSIAKESFQELKDIKCERISFKVQVVAKD